MERIRLDQHAFQIKAAQQLFEGGPLTGFVSVVGLLRARVYTVTWATKPWLPSSVSMAEPRSVLPTASRKPKGYTHQLVETDGAAWDLADHPGLQHLPELLQMGLIEQVEKGCIRRPTLELQAQRLVQRLSVPPGKRLQIPRTAAAAQDPEHRHQQQEPLGVTHPATVAAVRDGLEEADQIAGAG